MNSGDYVWQGNAYEGLTCDALEWHVSATGENFLQSDGTISALSDAAVDIYEQAAGWVGTISPPWRRRLSGRRLARCLARRQRRFHAQLALWPTPAAKPAKISPASM